ncbi:ZNHIT3 (predicted) [Pycnogonum litorale]
MVKITNGQDEQRLCNICQENDRKYKCPECKIPYCSLKCYKRHQPQCFPAVKPANHYKSVVKNSESLMESEDYVAEDKLRLLGDDEKVREALSNPHLRYMLSVINDREDVDNVIQAAMVEPIFQEFAEECLRVVGVGNSSVGG